MGGASDFSLLRPDASRHLRALHLYNLLTSAHAGIRALRRASRSSAVRDTEVGVVLTRH